MYIITIGYIYYISKVLVNSLIKREILGIFSLKLY